MFYISRRETSFNLNKVTLQLSLNYNFDRFNSKNYKKIKLKDENNNIDHMKILIFFLNINIIKKQLLTLYFIGRLTDNLSISFYFIKIV